MPCVKRRALFVANQTRRARDRARRLSDTFGFWFRRHYKLPPLDDRYLAMTPEDIETEFWAHRFVENPNEQEVVDEEFSLEDEIAAADAAAGDLPNDFEDV